MIIRRHSDSYNFLGDTCTGFTMHWGRTIADTPAMAPWPELADISISNRCGKNCSFCYRKSHPGGEIMPVEQYEYVLNSLQSQRWGNVFQVAIGGGEPLEHPGFTEIIHITYKKGIIANFTTNGLYLDQATINSIAGKTGALAISVTGFDNTDEKLITRLNRAGINTNLHFIVSSGSLEEATLLLKGFYNKKIKGIRNVIFLTYKPAGRACNNNPISAGSQLSNFLDLIHNNKCRSGIGFDACFVPMLLNNKKTDTSLVDTCECGFYSVYIDELANVRPCSFMPADYYSFNLEKMSFKDIWENEFTAYRNQIKHANKCTANCLQHNQCKGRCPVFPEITVCYESPECSYN